jgi:murein DD-endopeptidase MepM/ murein hydrolase activator NlpD
VLRSLLGTLAMLAIASGCAHRSKDYYSDSDAIRDGEEALDDEYASDQLPLSLPSMDQDRHRPNAAPLPRPPDLPDRPKRNIQTVGRPARQEPRPPKQVSLRRDQPPREGTYVANMMWPVLSYHVTSPYGVRSDPMRYTSAIHKGVDIRCAFGTPVWSAADGQVAFAGFAGPRGNTVEIRHSDQLTTVYAHLDRVDVQAGQRVQAGQQVGASGSSGRSTGPHLHYEVWQNGRPVDPLAVYGRDQSETTWMPEPSHHDY